MRFSRAGIALHEQMRAEQFLNVDRDRLPLGVPAYFNLRPHVAGVRPARLMREGPHRGYPITTGGRLPTIASLLEPNVWEQSDPSGPKRLCVKFRLTEVLAQLSRHTSKSELSPETTARVRDRLIRAPPFSAERCALM